MRRSSTRSRPLTQLAPRPRLGHSGPAPAFPFAAAAQSLPFARVLHHYAIFCHLETHPAPLLSVDRQHAARIDALADRSVLYHVLFRESGKRHLQSALLGELDMPIAGEVKSLPTRRRHAICVFVQPVQLVTCLFGTLARQPAPPNLTSSALELHEYSILRNHSLSQVATLT